MQQHEVHLPTLDTVESADRRENSQTLSACGTEKKRKELFNGVTVAEDERRDLSYHIFQLAILTEQEIRKIRSCYESLVTQLRVAILCPHLDERKDTLKAKLRTYCEEFIQIVDERVMPYYWVSVQVKSHLLRLKADYLRYLFEIHPKNGTYQVRAHNAYTEAKSFFVSHRLTRTSEWYRLRLNYSALLYLDGFPTAAMFLCQRLLKSAKLKLFDSAFEKRIRKNVDFFKRATLG
ncbi:unnamed protein product [Dicrocoelium dendriticum]|nr:unnamed protein product [Dicrocoelium dendriticum]